MEKSERDCDAECSRRERSREHEDCAHSKSKSSHHEHATGYEHGGRASKRGRSAEPGSSSEHPHSKERCIQSQSRSHDCEHADACTHQSCIFLLPPPFFHSTPINSCHTSADSLVGLRSFDMSRGSLPPDCGSLDIEMFTPPTGVVTPSSVNQFVSSSRPPTAMQLDAALAMTGLSKEQAEEIFLLTHEAQTLGRRLVHATSSSCPTRKHCSIWGSKPLGMKKLPAGTLTMLQHTTQ